MEAKSWVSGKVFPSEKPLINVSQAAPVDPPPEALRRVMADAALNNPDAHLYGPVLGLPALREQIARDWSRAYQGEITPDQVAVTSGCNQAYCAAIATSAAAGDNVILVAPWYFNHKMWLDMMGIGAKVLEVGADMLPDPARAAALIDGKTRAMVLVSPNNPSGAEYPADLLRDFLDLARDRTLTLIVDETYRDFDSREGPVHGLLSDPDWADHFVHLYSFSKAFRLTGHRVGAMLGSVARLAEAEKFLDTVTISPSQIGQIAALYGLQNLGHWLEEERQEILRRKAAIQRELKNLPDWSLLGAGAYFAYVRYPFDLPSSEIARKLVDQAHVLALPGAMFTLPEHAQNDRHLRLAFANIDAAGIKRLGERLKAFSPV